MNPKNLRNLIEQVYTTKENELDCDRFQAMLPQQVEAEINHGILLDSAFNAHRHHCPDCNDLYKTLSEVMDLEIHNELPSADELIEGIIAGATEQPLPIGEVPIQRFVKS